MATLTFELTVGAITVTRTISPTNARVLQFTDDLIAHYPVETPALTQTTAATKWINDLMDGQIAWAQALRQAELDKLVTQADDLEGNV